MPPTGNRSSTPATITSPRSPAELAAVGLARVAEATEQLLEVVEELDDAAMRRPSLCPGWSRGHVVSHLARNADALVNLLTWARTGVEHPMYASRADRDADIEEGANRPWRLLEEDLIAACERFTVAAEKLPESAWQAEVVSSRGTAFQAWEIPWIRLQEVWIHLIDLDCGLEFGDLPAEDTEGLLDSVVREFDGRPDVPSLLLTAELPDGHQRSWEINGSDPNTPRFSVRGPVADMLAWLTGRGDGAGLSGDLPELPAWI